jgi:hypothetical protein
MERFVARIKICGKPLPKAKKNGVDRGFCVRSRSHKGFHGGTRTCPHCGISLLKENCTSIRFKTGHGLCNECQKYDNRARYGYEPKNYQLPEHQHNFSCGCSGILPTRGKSNKFAIYSLTKKYWCCRVLRILWASINAAKKRGYKSMDPATPHSVIRNMMEEPNCERCKEPLNWKDLGLGKTPHLHHQHFTSEPYGKIYGFTHAHCNPQALENEVDLLHEEARARDTEIDRLKEEVRRLSSILSQRKVA